MTTPTDSPAIPAPTYSYSTDEERYCGDFASREDAAKEAFAETGYNRIWVGRNVTPIPENHISADLILDHIACQDDFNNDWGGDEWAGDVSKEQTEDLTAMLQKTVGEWINKHGLRPGFCNVEDIKEVINPANE